MHPSHGSTSSLIPMRSLHQSDPEAPLDEPSAAPSYPDFHTLQANQTGRLCYCIHLKQLPFQQHLL